MITTGIDKRIQVQEIVDNQLPEFILSESPKTVDFLKQYYISQEYRGGPIDITDNLDQYLKLDNLTPDVIVGITTLGIDITNAVDAVLMNKCWESGKDPKSGDRLLPKSPRNAVHKYFETNKSTGTLYKNLVRKYT